MFVDTHCHITSKDYDDIDLLIRKIKDSGISKIIVNGCDMESNLEVLKLTKKDCTPEQWKTISLIKQHYAGYVEEKIEDDLV